MVDQAELLRRARQMRRQPTDAEQRMWRMLRDRRLAGMKFRRQMPLGPYIVDFCCLSPRIIVECDGSQHAESAYDAVRDAWLRAQGFQVFRFWNSDILREGDGVADTLVASLARR